MIEPSNEMAPHKALIVIYAEVHETVPETGEFRGVPQLKQRFTFALSGQDKPILIRKLNELIQEIKQKCQS